MSDRRGDGRAGWVFLALAPALPVVGLLGLKSVWWTIALYHLGACLLLPLADTVLRRRRGLSDHLAYVGFTGGWVPVRAGIVWGLALGVGTVIVFALGRDAFLAGNRVDETLAAWSVRPAQVPLLLALLALGNGAAEELFWRGWLHRRLEGRTPRRLVLAITAAAYASYHVVTLAAFIASPVVILLLLAGVFGAGLFFGWLRERSGSVWPPLLAHGGATLGYLAAYLVWIARG